MASVYVENADRVVSRLQAFTPYVVDQLKVMMAGVASRIKASEQESLAAHSKTGRQSASVKTRVTTFKDQSVTATVSVGGKRAPGAHLFERGFQGSESVRAHSRKKNVRLKSGGRLIGKFDVRAYERKVSYRAHLYLDRAKESQRPATREAIAYAIGIAADDLELR